MYDKWNLNRNPFYTRAIERSSVKDFAGRSEAVKDLNRFSKDEGIVVIIGEPGIGSTSLANYCRFRNKQAFTVHHEFRMEYVDDGIGLMTTLIYGLAKDAKKGKLVKSILKNFVPDTSDLSFSVKAFGMGVNMKGSKKMTNNARALMDIFNELVEYILKTSKKDFLIIQLNNMNIHSPNSMERLHTVLDQLRDLFQVKKTLWYLLGDFGLEKVIKEKIPRLNSIVKHWVYLDPVSSEDFREIYNKRITNSGKNAISPFTSAGVDQLCNAAQGRIRYSLDIASSLIQVYADTIAPEFIDVDVIKIEAKKKIDAIIGKDSFTPNTQTVLVCIVGHPGITATEISRKTKILGGNITKSVNPLIDAGLVEKVMEGRSATHYPIGLAKLLTK